MKPLLVGEANPYQENDDNARAFALYPEPERASGARLCFVIMGLNKFACLRMFDRTNLCGTKWSIPAARRYASQLVAERGPDDVIVLCGSKVAGAFGVAYEPFSVRRFNSESSTLVMPTLVVLPHPSGLNRAWNSAEAIPRARAALREAGVLP